MRRVHRNLTRDEVEALRLQLTDLVPGARARVPELVKLMRLITRLSQTEYARLCGVAPRALADIEAGKGSPTVETLEKLLRPFGYRTGVVSDATADAAGNALQTGRGLTLEGARRSTSD